MVHITTQYLFILDSRCASPPFHSLSFRMFLDGRWRRGGVCVECLVWFGFFKSQILWALSPIPHPFQYLYFNIWRSCWGKSNNDTLTDLLVEAIWLAYGIVIYGWQHKLYYKVYCNNTAVYWKAALLSPVFNLPGCSSFRGPKDNGPQNN